MATKQAPEGAQPAGVQILSVYEAIARAKAECSPVGKNDKNTDQKFMFRGIDSVLNGVAAALNRYGVTFIPQAGDPMVSRYTSTRGSNMTHVFLPVTYQVRGADGSKLEDPIQVIGEAADAGDKVISKAMSVAFRTALIQLLNLPTGDPDPDTETHERAPMSAGDAWDSAQPAPPRGQRSGGNGNGHAQGNGARNGNGNGQRNGNGQQAQPDRPRPQTAPQPPLDPADDWYAKVQELASAEDARAAEQELYALFKAGNLDQDRGNRIRYAIHQRFPLDDTKPGPAPEQLQASRQAPPQRGQQSPAAKPGNDEGWVRQWKADLRAAASPQMDELRNRLGQGIAQRHITAELGTVLRQEWAARNRELTEMAGATA